MAEDSTMSGMSGMNGMPEWNYARAKLFIKHQKDTLIPHWKYGNLALRDCVHIFHFVVFGEEVPSLRSLDSYETNLKSKLDRQET